jgi:hypothetical protein
MITFLLGLLIDSEDEGSMYLQSIIRILPHYMTLRLHSHHYENLRFSEMVHRSLQHCVGGVNLFLFLLLMEICNVFKQLLILLTE